MVAATARRSDTIPGTTAHLIRELDDDVDQIRRLPHHPRTKRRLKAFYRRGAELKGRSDELVSLMERGEKWLADHEDHPQFAEREDQWIAWLREYEAIEDALERAKEVP